jgi:trehalose-6-phosphate synthase
LKPFCSSSKERSSDLNLENLRSHHRRAPGKDVEELQRFVLDLVEAVNARYRSPGYEPVVWLERSVPLYERIALYSIAGGLLSG